MTVRVFLGSLVRAVLQRGDFVNTDISQGREATHWRYDGIFINHFTANLVLSLLDSVKEFWRSVKMCRSYRREFGIMSSFFWNTMSMTVLTATVTFICIIRSPPRSSTKCMDTARGVFTYRMHILNVQLPTNSVEELKVRWLRIVGWGPKGFSTDAHFFSPRNCNKLTAYLLLGSQRIT